MITPELKNYIDQSKQSGINDAEIKNQLLSKGWSEQDVNEALSPSNTTAPTPPPPPTIDKKIFDSNIYGQVFLVIATAVGSLPVLAILFGSFTSASPDKSNAALISIFFFGGYATCLIIKAIIQASLLSKISKIVVNQPTKEILALIKKYKSSYPRYLGTHIITLSGLIPLIHLLAIWLVIPVGFLILLVYAEWKFFVEIKKQLPDNSLNLLPLKISLVAFYIFLPCLFLGIVYGLQAVT